MTNRLDHWATGHPTGRFSCSAMPPAHGGGHLRRCPRTRPQYRSGSHRPQAHTGPAGRDPLRQRPRACDHRAWRDVCRRAVHFDLPGLLPRRPRFRQTEIRPRSRHPRSGVRDQRHPVRPRDRRHCAGRHRSRCARRPDHRPHDDAALDPWSTPATTAVDAAHAKVGRIRLPSCCSPPARPERRRA